MNERGDAGLRQEGQNGLSEGAAGACVAGIELLNPVFGELSDTVDHGRLAHSGTSYQ